MKSCSLCKLPQEESEFYLRGDTDKLRSHCKTCQSKRAAAYYKENKVRHREASRRYSLKKLYGLSLEGYRKMCADQEYCCGICGLERPLAVDHDHQTGEVRGLLCKQCNTALGHFADGADLLFKALDYLGVVLA